MKKLLLTSEILVKTTFPSFTLLEPLHPKLPSDLDTKVMASMDRKDTYHIRQPTSPLPPDQTKVAPTTEVLHIEYLVFNMYYKNIEIIRINPISL